MNIVNALTNNQNPNSLTVKKTSTEKEMEKTHQTKQDKEKSYTERSESVAKDRKVLPAKGTCL